MATNALNRLEPRYYRVAITGAVDNLNIEDFAAANSNAFPTTKVQADAIEETNMFYEEIVRRVSERIQPLFVADTVTTNRTATVPATAISLTLTYDRPEFIITDDENNPGDLLGFDQAGSSAEDALQRMIARALINDIVQNRFIFDPTTKVGTTPRGSAMEEFTATALYADIATAEGNITVTEINNLVD